MISDAQQRRAQELAAAGVPYVTATVVRVQRPTSVEPGNVALVLPDGTIDGFVGGVCAEHSVRAYSLRTMTSGEPVLLRILPDAENPVDENEVDAAAAAQEISAEDGVVTVQNPCLSGGAIEVFLEPSLPAPRVLVVGATPIAIAVRAIGAELGLGMTAVGSEGFEPAAGDLALVVAGHGRDELHALRIGLEAGLPYVGLVASAKRGAGVLEELRGDGVADELLERIDVPAGLEIGARIPGEVALSILAKVVAVRRGEDAAAPVIPRTAAAPARPAAEIAALAVDPICGMTVAAVASTPQVQHDGETVYFCREGCKTAFLAQHEHAGVAD
jgi:xanthine dehydrogenase accessory factor